MKRHPKPQKLRKTIFIHLIQWVTCHICDKQYLFERMYIWGGEFAVWYVCQHCANDGIEAYKLLFKKGIGSH